MERDGIKGAECELVRRELSAYLDGELEDADAERIKNHIDGCDDCREVFEMLSDISEDIRSVKIDIPEDLHLHIMSAVNEEKAKDGGEKAKKFNSRIRKIALWCGAGAAAIICLTLIGSPIFRGGFELDMAKSADDAANFAADISFSGKAVEKDAVCEAEGANYSLFDSFNEDGAEIVYETKHNKHYSGSAKEEADDLEAVCGDSELLSQLKGGKVGEIGTEAETFSAETDSEALAPIAGQNPSDLLLGNGDRGEKNASEMFFYDPCAARGKLVAKKHE